MHNTAVQGIYRAVMVKRAFLLACLVLSSALAIVGGQVSDTIDQPTLDAGISAAAAGITSGSSPKSVFLASLALNAAGKKASKPQCDVVQQNLNTAQKIEHIGYISAAANKLQCRVTLSASQKEAVESSKSSKSTSSLFFVTNAIQAANLPVPDDLKPNKLITSVASRMEDDGSFRNTKKGKPKHVYAAFAYQVLQTAADSSPSKAAKAKLVAILSNFDNLLALGEAGDEFVGLGEHDRLLYTSMIVDGAFGVSSRVGAKLEVSGRQLARLAEFFVGLKHAQAADIAAAMVTGVMCIGKSQSQKPAAVVLQTPTIADNAAGEGRLVKIAVSDIFGNKLSGIQANVIAVSAQAAGSAIDMTESALKSTDGKVFSFDFLALKPAAGLYAVELSFTSASSDFVLPDAASLSVKVTSEAQFNNAKLVVSKSSKFSSGKPIGVAAATYPKSAAVALSAEDGQWFHVVVDITSTATQQPLNPHQVFVRLSHQETGESAIFVASLADASKGTHVFSVEVQKSNLFKASQDGRFNVELIVGDMTIRNSVQWKLGEITFSHAPDAPKKPEILYSKPLLHESDTTLKALPEISHKFREPDTRPPAVVSYTFTALVVLPLLVFIVVALSYGANIGKLFNLKVHEFPVAIAFVGCIGAILALYVVYWIRLTMFETLGYLCVLVAIALLTGNKTMRALNNISKND